MDYFLAFSGYFKAFVATFRRFVIIDNQDFKRLFVDAVITIKSGVITIYDFVPVSGVVKPFNSGFGGVALVYLSGPRRDIGRTRG